MQVLAEQHRQHRHGHTKVVDRPESSREDSASGQDEEYGREQGDLVDRRTRGRRANLARQAPEWPADILSDNQRDF